MVLSLLLPLVTLDLPCKDLLSTVLSSEPEFSFSSSSSETKDTVDALALASFLLLHESLLGVAIQLIEDQLVKLLVHRRCFCKQRSFTPCNKHKVVAEENLTTTEWFPI